jgi:S1-C subfamily serine protease
VQALSGGDVYVGEFRGDKRNGQGTLTFAGGNRYVGEFRDGSFHGQGVLYFLADGPARGDRYEGEFKAGKRDGQGTYTHADGGRYVGQYRDGRRHGRGIFTFANGNRYVGDHQDGKRHGQGTLTFASGDSYVGEFKDGSYDGQGTYVFASGTRYVGDFRDDKFHGFGIEYARDGSVSRQGRWAAGALVQSQALDPRRYPIATDGRPAGVAALDPGRAERDRLAEQAQAERQRRLELEAQLEAERKKRRVEAESRRGSDEDQSTGTGFLVAPGLLITNQHVVADCQRIDIVSPDGRRAARVIDADDLIDLALLRVSGLSGPFAPIRRPGSVRLGEPAYAFGFPLTGLLSEGGNFTSGVVSGLRGMRDAANQIQISTPVQPGNSGGAVVDSSGGVIGVVVAKLNATEISRVTGDIPQNVNFAVSLQTLVQFLRKNAVTTSSVERGASLDTAQLADVLRSFSHRVDCSAPPTASNNTPPRAPAAAPAAAAPPNTALWLLNRAGESIFRVYVSSTESNDWGDDLLGKTTLSPGERYKLEPSAEQGCRFDVRVEYRSGRSEEKRNQDFCALSELAFEGPRTR